jgi:hypothetical protein
MRPQSDALGFAHFFGGTLRQVATASETVARALVQDRQIPGGINLHTLRSNLCVPKKTGEVNAEVDSWCKDRRKETAQGK